MPYTYQGNQQQVAVTPNKRGDGFVVSLPQLFHARVSADFDNEIWNNCPPPSPPLHPLCSVDPESH